jgi:hypothetical protein
VIDTLTPTDAALIAASLTLTDDVLRVTAADVLSDG